MVLLCCLSLPLFSLHSDLIFLYQNLVNAFKSREFCLLHQQALHSGEESLREEMILGMFFLHFRAYR